MEIKDLLPLVGVVIGGVIAILGNLLSALIQRNQERIKFQKEIYENRFEKFEEYLNKYLSKYDELDFSKSIQEIKEDIFPFVAYSFDYQILQSITITEDIGIITSIGKFRLAKDNLGVLILDNQFRNKIVEREDYLFQFREIRNSCSNILISIDEFRLRGYKPKKKFFLIRFWNWLTNLLKKKTQSV